MPTDQPQHDGERQSDLAVMDAQEYGQKKRLERIIQVVMEEVRETSKAAWSDYVQGNITREARNITLQREVKWAIDEAYILLWRHQKRNPNDEYWHGDSEDPIGSVEVLGEKHLIVGLKDFLYSDKYYTETITEEIERRNMPNKTYTDTVEVTMPVDVSREAYRRLKEFLDDVHDIEIVFEEMNDRLQDEKPTSVELPDDGDLSVLDELNAPVDARAVGDDD